MTSSLSASEPLKEELKGGVDELCLLPLLLYLFYFIGVSKNCDLTLVSSFFNGEMGVPCVGDVGSRGTTFKTLRRKILATDDADRIKVIRLSCGTLCMVGCYSFCDSSVCISSISF